MKKIKKVKWLDHSSIASWMSKKEIKDWAIAPTICISYGEVTYEDSQVIVLSASHDGGENYGENICIYKVCIIK